MRRICGAALPVYAAQRCLCTLWRCIYTHTHPFAAAAAAAAATAAAAAIANGGGAARRGRNVTLAPDINVNVLARGTPGFR